MLDVEDKQLESILNQVMEKHKRNKFKLLISVTKQVENTDVLNFFAAAKEIASTRTFWTNKMEDFSIVGVGNIEEIQVTNNRYEETNRKWKIIQEKAVIHNPYSIPGTGLVALGGMSFDPKKPKSSLWKNYLDSQFYIPEFTLTKYKNSIYLTTNLILSSKDSPSSLAEEIQKKEQYLLTAKREEQTELKVVNKKEIEPEQWKEAVHQAREEIQNERLKKIVMARELRLKLSKKADITTVLENLLTTQPNSYVFGFEHGEDCFVGATPGRLVKVEKEKMLSMCLAGTAPRGKTKEEDNDIKHHLQHDVKNLQEHDFVVQMIRKSIESDCTEIDIPEKPIVRQLKNVQHLYTPVEAVLHKNASIFDIAEKLHPTPALGGTPTEEALAFIRENELLDRGWYGAPVGWIDSNDYGEFAVAIRSGLIHGDEASLFAGCGIVADSNIEEEYKETQVKFSPMLHALEGNIDNK